MDRRVYDGKICHRCAELQSACTCASQDAPKLKPFSTAAKPVAWTPLTAIAAEISTSLDGTILHWNAAAQRLLGYTTQETIGRNIRILLPERQTNPPGPSLDPAQRVQRFKSMRVRKDGKALPLLITQMAIENEHGELCGFSFVCRNLPRRRSAASDARHADNHVPAVRKLVNTPRPSAGIPAPPSARKSVLLATASAAGTIAAVRELGSLGMEVSVLGGSNLSAAAWSRRATHSYSAPSEKDVDRFLDRLVAIGVNHPGQILLPTSDETAWLYTLHAARLQQYFCLYQPSVATMRRILDKQLFTEAVSKAGLCTLPSWEPQTLEEVVDLAPTLPYPVLIKPRTHVHRLLNDKGTVAYSKAELIQQYQRFLQREHARAAENPLMPAAGLPILQQFVSTAKDGVCSVTGFINRTGDLFVTRRSKKVLQRSQPVGVGVCFESLPDSPELSEDVRRLCRELNYFGIFEVEFIRFDGGWAPIDFNARLFNQLGMDIRRGMPLPLFACLDAAGETNALRAAVAQAQAADADDQTVFCDGFTLRAILFARALFGRIAPDERDYWRSWIKRNAAHTVDYAAAKNDLLPGIVHALSDICLGLKSVPRFLHSMPRLSPFRANLAAKAKA